MLQAVQCGNGILWIAAVDSSYIRALSICGCNIIEKSNIDNNGIRTETMTEIIIKLCGEFNCIYSFDEWYILKYPKDFKLSSFIIEIEKRLREHKEKLIPIPTKIQVLNAFFLANDKALENKCEYIALKDMKESTYAISFVNLYNMYKEFCTRNNYTDMVHDKGIRPIAEKHGWICSRSKNGSKSYYYKQ